jgi:ATP-binding cassette, subfamily B, bacterial MsbA
MSELFQAYRRLLGYLRAYVPGLVGAVACMVLLALTTGLYAYLVGPVLEFLMTGGERGLSAIGRLVPSLDPSALDRDTVLIVLPLSMVAVGLLKGIAYFGQFYLMGVTGQKVVVDLRRHLYRHLVSMPAGWFARRHSGDLISRFTHDVVAVETAVTYAAASIFRDGMQVLVLLGLSFYLDWRLALIAFGVIPITLYPLVRFARRLRKHTGDSNRLMGRISERVHETVAGIRVVQAYGMEAQEIRRFDDENDDYVRVMKRSFLVRAVSSPTMELMAVTGLAAILWYATSAVATGGLEASAFLSFFATVMLMYQPVKSLSRMGQFIVTGATSAERIFEVLDSEPGIRDAPDAEALPPISEAIRFENVTFAYEADRPALTGIDLALEKGQILALVGPSGGGKTTLVSLLPRFFDPDSGRVTIDGHDVRGVTLASLRAQIALVSQETVIFNDTVRANVLCGRPDASEAEIWDALERAQAKAFVEALPGGLDTPLGERGVSLSGGQRQRIAIARALLKDAPILILDEATSSLDTESERAVQEALSVLMAGRTVLVVAHRLSTIREADRIVVVDGGRIVESGRHEDLLAEGGLYRRLHDLQGISEPVADPGAAERAAGG